MPQKSDKPIEYPDDEPTQEPLNDENDELMSDAGVTNDDDSEDNPMPPPGGPGT